MTTSCVALGGTVCAGGIERVGHRIEHRTDYCIATMRTVQFNSGESGGDRVVDQGFFAHQCSVLQQIAEWCVSIGARLAGEAEHTLAQGVLLYLVGAAAE